MTPIDDRAEPPIVSEFGGFEIYPMPMFPTLSVTDVAGVAAWYEATLGFKAVFAAPAVGGQPSLIHLRRRKYQDLLIVPSPAEAAAAANLTLTFNADGELDEISARAHAGPRQGHSAIAGPVDTPWNTRDLRVTDPVGTRLLFTARNPHPDPEQAARIKAMFDAARAKQPD
jgi:uncharacterized glyoxalase superfamily protein PhnB